MTEKVEHDRQPQVFGFVVGDDVIIWTAASALDGITGTIVVIRGSYVELAWGTTPVRIPISMICGIGRAP